LNAAICSRRKDQKAGGEEDAQARPKSAKKETRKTKIQGWSFFEAALDSVAENTYLLFSCPYNFDSSLKTSKAVPKSVA